MEKLPGGEAALKDVDIAAAVMAAAREHEAHQEQKSERIDQMQAYAETQGCRRQFLLRYFGEELAEPCQHCDNCLKRLDVIEADPARGTRREV